MASEGDAVRGGLQAARIPMELNADLDSFFSRLKLAVLDKAVRQASMRNSDEGTCTVQTEDVLTSARAALAGAASELEQALTTHGPRYVRKAS